MLLGLVDSSVRWHRCIVLAIGCIEKNTPSIGTPATGRTGGVNPLSRAASAMPIFRSVMKNGPLSKDSDNGHFFSGT